MSLIPEDEQEHLRELFKDKLSNSVKLLLFTSSQGPCEYCGVAQELVKEVSGLSGGVVSYEVRSLEGDRLARDYGVSLAPTLVLLGDKDYRVRFVGLPAGYEFGALIDDIIDVSRRSSRLSPSTKSALDRIKEEVEIKVFVTPSCPYCPKAVRLAHMFAMENNNIWGYMIEALEFPDLANKYNVMSVPHVVINDSYYFVGAYPEPLFLQHVLRAVGLK